MWSLITTGTTCRACSVGQNGRGGQCTGFRVDASTGQSTQCELVRHFINTCV